MIFSTLNQLNCFILSVFIGIIFGLIFSFFEILFLKKYAKIFKKIIFEGIFYSFFAIFYVFFINFYNFGKISYVLILGCVLGFLWAKKVLKNLVGILTDLWYNYIIKKKETYNGRKSRKAKGQKN